MRYARASQIRNNRFAIHASADPFELDRGRCGFVERIFPTQALPRSPMSIKSLPLKSIFLDCDHSRLIGHLAIIEDVWL